ncbi:putative transporter SVOPL [Pectinophora gossypiella]|uniref:putative transporter SVOPL n=1 Tax=Pectinophora gossypiella TaxID=13191 RepID=UPI00214E001D|nr:putative transporter SVOPL [Pectinophora gossypiella]
MLVDKMSETNNNDLNIAKVPFETALDKANFGPYSYMLTVLTGVSIISYACMVYSSTIIVPTSACELGTTHSQQGLLVAGPLVGAILGAILWGYLADRHGRRSMLLVSFLSAAVVNSVASLSVNWIMLIVLQFLVALLASGQYSLAMTLLSECVPMARRNLVVLIVASIFLLAQGVMALLAIPIIPLEFSYHLPSLGIYWNPWRTVLLVYSLPSLICLLGVYFMMESPKFVYAKGDEERSLDILKYIHKVNSGRNSKEEYQVKGLLADTTIAQDDGKSLHSVAELLKAPLLKYLIIMSTLSVFQQVGAFTLWLPTIANQFVNIVKTGEGRNYTLCQILVAGKNASRHSTLPACALNETALLIVFGMGCIQSLCNIFLSMVVNYGGRRNTVMVLASVSGVSGILVNLVPDAVGSAVFFVIFLMGLLLLGLYTAISVALFPTHLRALAVSLTMTGGRVVLFAVVQILNFLLKHNCDLGFYIFASIIAASAVVVSFLPDDRRKQLTPPKKATKAVQTTQNLDTTEKNIQKR